MVYGLQLNQSDDDIYLKVSGGEGQEFIELSKEEDNTVLFTFIESQFPSAVGLKYKDYNGDWNFIKPVGDALNPPKNGWGQSVYYAAQPIELKRKDSKAEPDPSKIAKLMPDRQKPNVSSFKSRLHELARKRQVSFPSYQSAHVNSGFFSTVTFDNQKFISLMVCKRKKDAEHSAAQAAFNVLIRMPLTNEKTMVFDELDVNNNNTNHSTVKKNIEVQVKNKDLSEQPRQDDLFSIQRLPLASFLDNYKESSSSQRGLRNEFGNTQNSHDTSLARSNQQQQQQQNTSDITQRDCKTSITANNENIEDEDDGNFIELAAFDFPSLNSTSTLTSIASNTADEEQNGNENSTPKMTSDEKVLQLMEMFPDVPNPQLRRCLSRSRGNLEKAICAILSYLNPGFKTSKKEMKVNDDEPGETSPEEIESNERDISRLIEMFPRLSKNRIRDRYHVVGKSTEKAMKVILQEEQARANGYLGRSFEVHKTSSKKTDLSQDEETKLKENTLSKYFYRVEDPEKEHHPVVLTKKGTTNKVGNIIDDERSITFNNSPTTTATTTTTCNACEEDKVENKQTKNSKLLRKQRYR